MHTDIEMVARQQIAERTAAAYLPHDAHRDQPVRRRTARVLHRLATKLDPNDL